MSVLSQIFHDCSKLDHSGDPSRTAVKIRAQAIIAQFAIIFIDIILLNLMSYSGCEPIEITHSATVMLLITFFYGAFAWKLIGKSWFDPFFLLFLSAYMYNSAQFVIDYLGYETGTIGPTHTVFRFSTTTIRDTVVLILNSINVFLLGGLIASSASSSMCNGIQKDESATRLIGWILLGIAVIPSFLSVKEQLTLRMSDGYGALWVREQATGFGNWMSVLAGLLVPGVLFLLAGSRGRPFCILTSFLGLAIQSGSLIIVGDRSGAIMPLVGFAWVFHHCIRPLPQVLLACVALLMVGVVVPLIPQIRNMSASDYGDPSVILNAYTSINNPLIQTFDESGASAFVVADVLELVPRRSRHSLGLGYLNTCLINLNFLFPIDLTGRGELSKWLIYVQYPWRADAGLWLGFSFIAEAYIEFGWIGGPIALGIIAFLIVKLSNWATNISDAAKIGMVGTFALLLPHFARGNSMELARPFLRYALIPYMMVRILEWSRQGSRLIYNMSSQET